MYDHVTCGVCGYRAEDLTNHIKGEHSLNKEDYAKLYGPFICSLVDKKRKATTAERHGDPNYRNEEARKFSYSSYEGGHPLSDPDVREKQRETKRALYGDPDYVNIEQRIQTNKKKYGVEHYISTEEFQKKAKEWRDLHGSSMKGKIPHNKKEIPSKEEIEQVFKELGRQESVAKYYEVSCTTLTSWLKLHNISYEKVKIDKHMVLSPYTIVKEYLGFCRQKKELVSFYGFAKEEGRGDLWGTKLKRVFKPTSKYISYKADFEKMVLADEETYTTWLLNFKKT